MNHPVLLPLKKSLSWILLSACLTFCVFGGGCFYWNALQKSRASDPHFNIVAIVQSCTTSEPLQTNYLAELLGLSINQPTNLYRFNIRESQLKLLNSPIIKSAQIKKIKPSIIYVEYALRKPVAYLAEYSNTAIDDEGVIIPAKPFYTPKKACELVFGLTGALEWGSKISGKKLHLVQALREKITQLDLDKSLAIKRIDVSKAFSSQCGEREIVLFLEESVELNSPSFMSILRLSLKNWDVQLANYRSLRAQLISFHHECSPQKKSYYIIDMRILQVAFIAKASYT